MDNPRIFIGEEGGAEEAKKINKSTHFATNNSYPKFFNKIQSDSINSEPNIKKDIIN